ncbi:MAG: hypothetical protein JNL06_17485 [Alphaproteobacteria bacterium]|nr:hypothetical protein [Alphaproteobacteria bacterium]
MSVRSRAFLAGAFVLGGLALAGVERFAIEAEAAPDCSAAAWRNWTPVKGRAYRTEAFSNGGNCATAVVTIAVRAPDGTVLWSDAAPGAHVMTFAGVKTRGEMVKALSEWLSQDHMFKTSADFPPWAAGDETPKSGEFPFYPETGVDRETYEQIRAQKLPVFCYVQGMESLACLTVTTDGQMEKIGVQLFPG